MCSVCARARACLCVIVRGQGQIDIKWSKLAPLVSIDLRWLSKLHLHKECMGGRGGCLWLLLQRFHGNKNCPAEIRGASNPDPVIPGIYWDRCVVPLTFLCFWLLLRLCWCLHVWMTVYSGISEGAAVWLLDPVAHTV